MVDAGTHTIDLEVVAVASTTGLSDASVWVMWVPFDGTGATPATVTPLAHLEQLSEPADE